MKVIEVVNELKKYDENTPIYIRKAEFFGNVGYAFYVSMVKHPVIGTDCIVLRDDEPYEVYYEDYEDNDESLGHCAGCEHYEDCYGCEECEHVANRDVKYIESVGCSSLESKLTVGKLVDLLSKVDEEIDVMTRPRNRNKNFCDATGVEMGSYAFFGSEISCAYIDPT